MPLLLARRGRWLYRAERAPGPLALDWVAELDIALGADWRLERNAHGAPVFTRPEDAWLSRSHADGIDVLVISRRGPVGIDVEARTRQVSPGVLRRLLTPAERAWCDPERPELAVLAWCAKEALTKALGRGIAYGLQRLVLGPPPPTRSGLVRIRLAAAQDSAAAWRWRIIGHLGADRVLVAAEAHPLEARGIGPISMP